MTKIIFVDTNLFLRYLTNDIPEQADKVEGLLLRAQAGEIKLVTSVLVIAEIVWTLSSFYRLSKEHIRDSVLSILNTEGLEVAEANLLLEAVVDYVARNVDFIDAFNVAWMKQHGIDVACTFDRKHFSRFDGLVLEVL